MRNEEIMTDSQKLDLILSEISILNEKVKMIEMEFENLANVSQVLFKSF